jgi:hypothetical protein
MRHFIVGASLLALALAITFGAASILQGMAEAKKTVVAEPFVIDKIRPAATVTRGPTNERGGRSVILDSRRGDS